MWIIELRQITVKEFKICFFVKSNIDYMQRPLVRTDKTENISMS